MTIRTFARLPSVEVTLRVQQNGLSNDFNSFFVSFDNNSRCRRNKRRQCSVLIMCHD